MQRLARGLIGHLPRGGGLDEDRRRALQRLLTAVLALHVPALALVGLLAGWSPGGLLLALAPVGVAVALAARAPARIAATASALGLVAASAAIAAVPGGATAAALHAVVVLGLVALYHDWTPFLAATVAAVAALAAAEVLRPGAPGPQALVPGAFLLAAAAVQVLWWRLNERVQHQSRDYYRQLYEGERALVAHLREAERVKSELVAVVGHEFRTPLASIIGYAQTIEKRFDKMDRATLVTFLRTIDRQAHRLEKVVVNLLASSGGMPSTPDAAADLERVALRVVDDLARQDGACGHVIAVDVEPGLTVRMSAESAARVLANLLDNAVKFSTPGTEIRLSARRVGQTAVLEVADLGSPIVDGDLERIFDPFVQVDSSDTRRVDGIGLGLHTVRRIVEVHGGSVQVRNAEPWVVFTVTLPAAVGAVPPAIAAPALPGARRPASEARR
jgi:signal transduction histidine kinase